MVKKYGFVATCAVTLLIAVGVATVSPTWAVTAFSIVTCGSTTACTGGTNSSSGPGVQGKSLLGKGVVGQTTFASTSSSTGQNGVLGQDLSTSGSFDTGVAGTSARGIGVLGASSSNAGIRGTSSSGTAVVGTTSTGAQAILGSATSTVGVTGKSTSATGSGNGVQGLAGGFGVGVFGQSAKTAGVWGSDGNDRGVLGNGNAGVVGEDFGGVASANNRDAVLANGYGGRLFRGNNSQGQDVFVVDNSGFVSMGSLISGNSTESYGVQGFGTIAGVEGQATGGSSGIGVAAEGTSSAGSVAVYAGGEGGYIYYGRNSQGAAAFAVDDGGNVHAHSFTSDLAAATRTSSGSTIATFSHESRSPTIEDFGEARLEAGQAYVRLNSDFAGAITRGYYVFVTPLGPTQGLYVSRRTASGFYVRETSGRSNVAFDYRIVGERPVQALPRPVATIQLPKHRPPSSFPVRSKEPPIP